MEDVTGGGEAVVIINRVDDDDSEGIIRCERVLHLKTIIFSNICDKYFLVIRGYRHLVAGMINETQLHLLIIKFHTDRLLSILIIKTSVECVHVFRCEELRDQGCFTNLRVSDHTDTKLDEMR